MSEREIVGFRFNAPRPDFVFRCLGCDGDLVDCFQRDWLLGLAAKRRLGFPLVVETDRINPMLAGRNEKRPRKVHGETLDSLGSDDLPAIGHRELERDVLVAPTVVILKDRLGVLGRIGEHHVKLFNGLASSESDTSASD